MKNLILIILVFVMALSCTSKSQVKLFDDQDVCKVFNKEEILSLSLIVNFFDRVIVEGSQMHDINDGYHRYFSMVRELESFEDLETRVGLGNSTEVEKLIDRLIDEDIFDKIWEFEYGYDYRTKDTISISLTINMQGKYLRLLELLGAQNDFLLEYVSTIKSFATIPPSLIAGFLRAYINYDFYKEVNRLVWAVHYITILSEKKFEKDILD